MSLRLMAVHAHPDDESSKGAATLAKYAAEGVEVLVVTCTGGERGDVLNPALSVPEIRANIPEFRAWELARAQEILGFQHRWLGFVDSGMARDGPLPPGCFAGLPLAAAARPLVAAIREFRPQVMLTYDEDGGYPHPDHVMCHRISAEGFAAAADPARYRGTGRPWQPLKLYYHLSFHEDRFAAEHAAMRRSGLTPRAGELLAEIVQPAARWPVTTRVRCADHFEARDRALLAHATQIAPDGPWFDCPRSIQREAWPTEDYHLARSLVPAVLPEDDLFSGIDPGTDPGLSRCLPAAPGPSHRRSSRAGRDRAPRA